MKRFLLRSLLLLIGQLFILTLAACRVTLPDNQPQAGYTMHYNESAAHYLEHASEAESPERESLQLQAAGKLLQEHEIRAAEQVLTSIDPQKIPPKLRTEKSLLEAHTEILLHNPQQALTDLSTLPSNNALTPAQQLAKYQLVADAQEQQGENLLSAEAKMALEPLLHSDSARQHNRQAIWRDLNQLSTDDLASQLRSTSYGQLNGWLKVVYLSKQYADEPEIFQNELQLWRQRYALHPANSLLPKRFSAPPVVTANHHPNLALANNPPHIALLLPLKGKLASSGEAIRSGFMASFYTAQDTQKNTVTSIEVYDTQEAPIESIYSQAIAAGANVIVGPLTKQNVQSLERMGRLPVPTLALNFTANAAHNVPNLYQFALSPQDEASQAAKRSLEDKKSRALVIVPDSDWGHGISSAFTRHFELGGGQVMGQLTYTAKTDLDKAVKTLLDVDKSQQRHRNLNRILGERTKSLPQRRQDIDAIFLVAKPDTARQIRPLLTFYYAQNVPVYATSLVYSGKPNQQRDKDLDGIAFCDTPWNLLSNDQINQAKNQLDDMLPHAKQQQARLFAFGADAYQLASQIVSLPYKEALLVGLTGDLYLNRHQVHRHLPWATFEQGEPIALRKIDNENISG